MSKAWRQLDCQLPLFNVLTHFFSDKQIILKLPWKASAPLTGRVA
jgi:hypothetical protein